MNEKKICECKQSPDDYLDYLKSGLKFHQAKLDAFNLAINAYKKGFEAGRKFKNEGAENV